jgi:hypothetical protein
MIGKMFRSLSFVAALLFASLAPAPAVLAGPPLICHPFEIGNAKSLPWAGTQWRDVQRDYDLNRLVPDTLALLTPETPVLVRMETLRRATIYAVWSKIDHEVGIGVKDSKLADELMNKLMERIRESVRIGNPSSLAMFDAGYLAAAYKQAGYQSTNAANKLDGYHLMRKGNGLNPTSNPEIEFALAKLSQNPEQATHREHLRRALDGAQESSLLARNLVIHFGKPGQKLSALRAQIASVRN